MSGESLRWLSYAAENLRSAEVLLESGLYNPSLQNAQQAVEKCLKSLLIRHSLEFKRTHSIAGLRALLAEAGVVVDLSDDECDLLDSIYLPSRYPLGSALPDFEPDEELCHRCSEIAERVLNAAGL
ncbi:HEPN domain-containing protein [Candidatus Fermentibacteria bacterium]|nr:HEPN domain-containing protein [Candidatus Fermentibacteria bacterium]